MSDLTPFRKLSIAISGGGLAGATLANALVHQPHLEVNVYESAPEFSERGAAVGLAGNAQRSLQAIIPSAEELLNKAGAVSMNSTRVVIGSGEAAGSLVFDLAGQDPGRVVHRAALLKELLAPLPAKSLHTNKRIVEIDSKSESSDGVKISFHDGTSAVVDAVIGADGIFGFTRQHVLGTDDSATKPISGGWWDCRNLVSIEKAKERLGEEYFREPRQFAWVGSQAFIMHDVLDDGKTVQFVAAVVEKEASAERKRTLSRELLEYSFKDWLKGPIAPGMIDLLLDQDDATGYSQWEHLNASTYVKGRVCLAGDAAHAMTPWQGSGTSQAIEDAMILGTLFAAISRPEQIDAALRAYDFIRRPRSQAIVESSKLTGQIMTGQVVEIEPAKMAEALSSRWAFIHDFDAQKHKEDALAALDRYVNM